MAPRTRDFYQSLSPKKRNIHGHNHGLVSPSYDIQPKQEPFRQGDILCDVSLNKWKIGRCIGVGAFGDVYLASNDISKSVTNEAQYVIKVEPHSNGPLFVEMNFYLRATKQDSIDSWKSKHKRVKNIGVPRILGFGSHIHKNDKYRFIVMPRYGENVNKKFIQNNKKFHVKTAFTIAQHVLDVLEYVHDQGYIHLDIKGANMLLGNNFHNNDESVSPLYLVDYGLATKYVDLLGIHKEFHPDRRKAEAGTLEYISRDAHLGAMARRSDLESLGYNLVHWLTGSLPWLNSTSPSEDISHEKNEAMSNINQFLSECFTHSPPPPVLREFLEYVDRLSFKSEPDYDYCRKLFSQAIRDSGFLDDGIISFDSHVKLTNKSKKRKAERENETLVIKKPKLKKRIDTPSRRPFRSVPENTITTRVTRNQVDSGKKLRSAGRDFDWATVLAGHPEKELKNNNERKTKKQVRIQQPCNTSQSSSTPLNNKSAQIPKFWKDSLKNPTPAMLKIMKNKRSRRCERRSRSDSIGPASYYTPAMQEVIASRQPLSRYSPKGLRSSSRKTIKKSLDAMFACGQF